MKNASCGCNSGQSYDDCCQPWHQGRPAPTAEALMRSRFCAFRSGLADYLLATWHDSTRPVSLGDLSGVRWLALAVTETGVEGDHATVTFEARGLEDGKALTLQETSRFVQEAGRWFYVDGNAVFSRKPVGRNEPCLCGSGNKAKRCCLA